MLRPFVLCLLLVGVTACAPEQQPENQVASAVAVSNGSAIASAVLNVQQSEDILQSSKQAMAEISASDIAAAEQMQFNPQSLVVASEPDTASSAADLPPLPTACSQYFQRAQACYQTQAQAEGLLQMLEQQQMDLAADNPDANMCDNLARSFDAVAINLGCR